MGSQRVGHDWATELNWIELKSSLQRLPEISIHTEDRQYKVKNPKVKQMETWVNKICLYATVTNSFMLKLVFWVWQPVLCLIHYVCSCLLGGRRWVEENHDYLYSITASGVRCPKEQQWCVGIQDSIPQCRTDEIQSVSQETRVKKRLPNPMWSANTNKLRQSGNQHWVHKFKNLWTRETALCVASRRLQDNSVVNE